MVLPLSPLIMAISALSGGRHAVLSAAPGVAIPRAASCAMNAAPPPPPGQKNLEVFFGTVLKVTEEATKAATEAADQYLNTGWQVKKRSGQLFPEIRPNAANVDTKVAQVVPDMLGMAGPSGSLAQVETQATGIMTADSGALELQDEFCTFLAPLENERYRTTPEGEIIFASRADLAGLVAEFSYGKLKELAAAARALARYVDDLEGELEAADDAVVKLRRELSAGNARLEEASAAKARLVSDTEELKLELERASAALLDKEALLSEKERAAEHAAEQLLEARKGQEAAVEATQGEAKAQAVRLEQELMAAEKAAADLEDSKGRLEATVTALQKQQEAAAEEKRAESARVRALEKQAEEAEAAAEARAKKLADSEASVAALQAQLEQLKKSVDAAQPPAGGGANGKANGVANAKKANGAVPVAASAAPPAAATKPASATANGAAKPKTFADEAAELTKEIEAQLQSVSGGGGSGAGGRGGSPRPLALSKMKKAELVAECEARKLDGAGSVAELRAMLRVERKRDDLIAQLVERGWSERQSRSALNNNNWDVDAAIEKLTGR